MAGGARSAQQFAPGQPGWDVRGGRANDEQDEKSKQSSIMESYISSGVVSADSKPLNLKSYTLYPKQ